MAVDELEDLREEWSTLYRKTLPELARSKDSRQSNWPVSLDHCFARIILDNTIGRDAKHEGQYEQWDTVIKKPAVRNMTQDQFKAAIALGYKIVQGEADLQELDEISLKARGKNVGKYGKKRKADQGGTREKSLAVKKQKSEKQQTTLSFKQDTEDSEEKSMERRSSLEQELNTASTPDIEAILKRIHADNSLTAYRKRLYAILLTVPIGRFTTYQAMSDYLNSSARAVGNGMRNNPFAPDVPCHRVLASDRSIGGFGGSWGKDGQNAGKKIKLLQEEGVKFDSSGKAKGPIFIDFQDVKL